MLEDAADEDTLLVQLMEPDKCEGWEWYSFRQMRELNDSYPERLFLPLRNLLAQRPEVCAAMESDEERLAGNSFVAK